MHAETRAFACMHKVHACILRMKLPMGTFGHFCMRMHACISACMRKDSTGFVRMQQLSTGVCFCLQYPPAQAAAALLLPSLSWSAFAHRMKIVKDPFSHLLAVSLASRATAAAALR